MTSFKLVHYCSLAVKDVAISPKIGQPERETARGLTGWSKGQEEERVWGGAITAALYDIWMLTLRFLN